MRKKNLLVGEFRVYPVSKSLAQSWFVQGLIILQNGKTKRMKFRVPDAATVGERDALAAAIERELLEKGYQAKEKRESEFKAANYILRAMDELLIEKKNTVRKKTYQSYLSHLRNFNTFCGVKKVVHVSEGTAADFLKWLQVTGRSATTVNAHRVTLRYFFDVLFEQKKVKTKPFAATKKLKEHREGARYFNLQQIGKIKNYVLEHKPFLWLPCIMQFYTFLRPSAELRFIRVGDVDLGRGVIRVKSTIAKNGKNEFVKIPDGLRPYLLDLKLEDLPNDYFLIGHDGVPAEKGVSYNFWGGHFRAVRKALRFGEEYKFYSFKHSGAVDFILNGGNVAELQKQLRHHSLDMTAVYLRSLGIMDIDNLGSKFSAI
jgi:integrase